MYKLFACSFPGFSYLDVWIYAMHDSLDLFFFIFLS